LALAHLSSLVFPPCADVEEAPCEDYKDIVAPSLSETLLADDIIFISSAQDVVEKLMKSIAGESKGLYILQSNVLSLPGQFFFPLPFLVFLITLFSSRSHK
jgi:hypothetical protein